MIRTKLTSYRGFWVYAIKKHISGNTYYRVYFDNIKFMTSKHISSIYTAINKYIDTEKGKHNAI